MPAPQRHALLISPCGRRAGVFTGLDPASGAALLHPVTEWHPFRSRHLAVAVGFRKLRPFTCPTKITQLRSGRGRCVAFPPGPKPGSTARTSSLFAPEPVRHDQAQTEQDRESRDLSNRICACGKQRINAPLPAGPLRLYLKCFQTLLSSEGVAKLTIRKNATVSKDYAEEYRIPH